MKHAKSVRWLPNSYAGGITPPCENGVKKIGNSKR
jgi:hypothetical protein